MSSAPLCAAAVASDALNPSLLALDARLSPVPDFISLPPSLSLPLPLPVFSFGSPLPQLSPPTSPAYAAHHVPSAPRSLPLLPAVTLVPALSSPAVLMLPSAQQAAGSREWDARLRSQPEQDSELQEMAEQEEAGARLHSHLSIDVRDTGSGRRYSSSSQAASPPLVSSPAPSAFAVDENGSYLHRLQQHRGSRSVSDTGESLSPSSLSQSRGSPGRDRALPAERSVMMVAAAAVCDMCEAAVAEWFCCQCELRMCHSDLEAHARLYAVGHQLHELRQHKEEEERRQQQKQRKQQQQQSSSAAQQQHAPQHTEQQRAAGTEGSTQPQRHQQDVSSLVRAEVEQQILQITHQRTEEERLLIARKQAAGAAEGRKGGDTGPAASFSSSRSGRGRGRRLPSHRHVGLDTPTVLHRLMPLAGQHDDIVRRWESLQDDLPRLYPKPKRNAAARPALNAAASAAASSSLLPPQAESSRLDLQHLLPIAPRLNGRSLSAASPSRPRQRARLSSPPSPVASPVIAFDGRRGEQKDAMLHSNGLRSQDDASLSSLSTRSGMQRSRSSGLLLGYDDGVEQQERNRSRSKIVHRPIFQLLSPDVTAVASQHSQQSVSLSGEDATSGSDTEQQPEQQRRTGQAAWPEDAGNSQNEEAEEEKTGSAAAHLSYPSDIPPYRSVVMSEQSQAAAVEPAEDGGYAATGWAPDGRHARLTAMSSAGERAGREHEPQQEEQRADWQHEPHLSAYMRENRERFMQAMQREEKERGEWQQEQQRLHSGGRGDDAELSGAARGWQEDEDLNAAVWVEGDEAEAEQPEMRQQQAQARHTRRPQSPPASSRHHARLSRAFSRLLLYLDGSLPTSHHSASYLRSLDSDISLISSLLQRVTLDRSHRRWPAAAKSWPSASVPQHLHRRHLRASPPVRPVAAETDRSHPRAAHARLVPPPPAPEAGSRAAPHRPSHRLLQAEAGSHGSHASAHRSHRRQQQPQQAEAERLQLQSQRRSRKQPSHRPPAAQPSDASAAMKASRTAPASAGRLSPSSSVVDASHGAIHEMPHSRSRSHSRRQPQRPRTERPHSERPHSPLVTVSASGVMTVQLPQSARSSAEAAQERTRQRRVKERTERMQDAAEARGLWVDAVDPDALLSQSRFAELDCVMPRSTAKVR